MKWTIGSESSKALPVCLNLYIFRSALICQLSTIEVNTGRCALFQCNYEITVLQSIHINYAFVTECLCLSALCWTPPFVCCPVQVHSVTKTDSSCDIISHHIISHYVTTFIVTLYRLLHFKFIVHFIATYVFHSFLLPYFIPFLPPNFPPFFPLFFLSCTLSFSLSPTTNTSHASSMYCSI